MIVIQFSIPVRCPVPSAGLHVSSLMDGPTVSCGSLPGNRHIAGTVYFRFSMQSKRQPEMPPKSAPKLAIKILG